MYFKSYVLDKNLKLLNLMKKRAGTISINNKYIHLDKKYSTLYLSLDSVHCPSLSLPLSPLSLSLSQIHHTTTCTAFQYNGILNII